MTEEEIIEAFNRNYDVFSKVAEYLLATDEHLTCPIRTTKLAL